MSPQTGSLDGRRKAPTIAQVIIERIINAYSREDARRDGIYFWPDPLPTPVPTLLPDPLVLFKPVASVPGLMLFSQPPPLIEEQRERLSVLPMTLHDAKMLRTKSKPTDPPMQIPLGLVDIPELQERNIFWVDLHGSSGALTGGPLLIAGAQNSGKATALQTILLWLIARSTPAQLRCAIIDPNHDLDFFQDLPYLRDTEGNVLWTEGNNDEQITAIADRFTSMITKRREGFQNKRWDESTIGDLRSRGEEVPLYLMIISHYHSFAERFKSAEALKKLVLTIAEARALGAYVIITSAEVGRFIPPDLMGKMGTKIGLFLNEQQRYDLLGRTSTPLEPIPGRGLVLTRDRSMHEVQLALPVPGATETIRYETLKREVMLLAKQTY